MKQGKTNRKERRKNYTKRKENLFYKKKEESNGVKYDN